MIRKLLGAGLWITLHHSAAACTSCFGAAGDQATHGLNMAILTLLGVMCTVVGSAFVCIVVIVLRSSGEAPETRASLPTPVFTHQAAEGDPC
jgi:hypothetical protein